MTFTNTLVLVGVLSICSACATPESTALRDLTAASVASALPVGKATQADVLKMYGEPNAKRKDKDGSELWEYRVAFKTMTSGSAMNRADQAQEKTLAITFFDDKRIRSHSFSTSETKTTGTIRN